MCPDHTEAQDVDQALGTDLRRLSPFGVGDELRVATQADGALPTTSTNAPHP